MPVTDGGLVMVAQGRGEGQRGGDAQLGAAPESNPGACTFPSKKKKIRAISQRQDLDLVLAC